MVMFLCHKWGDCFLVQAKYELITTSISIQIPLLTHACMGSCSMQPNTIKVNIQCECTYRHILKHRTSLIYGCSRPWALYEQTSHQRDTWSYVSPTNLCLHFPQKFVNKNCSSQSEVVEYDQALNYEQLDKHFVKRIISEQLVRCNIKTMLCNQNRKANFMIWARMSDYAEFTSISTWRRR